MQAAIVYEKLDDVASLVRLYVEGRHWDEVSVDVLNKTARCATYRHSTLSRNIHPTR